MKAAVITTYFNPSGYATRRRNYDLFIAGIRAAGVMCLTVECVFPGQEFELPESPDVIRVRAKTLLWQKERLLNLAESYLPADIEAVAWIDCDVLFLNRNWPRDLTRVLKKHPVAQMFEFALRMDREGISEAEPRAESFGAVMTRNPLAFRANRYDVHGHTGYAWAMRRSLFRKVGLYEAAVAGGADHFMSHALFDDYGFCIQNAMKDDPVQIAHLTAWGKRFRQAVVEEMGGDTTANPLGVVPGQIRHLWHGDLANRKYFLRLRELISYGFNPFTDLVALPGQPLEWSQHMNKPELEKYFGRYFNQRREDGIEETHGACSC